MSEPTLSEIQKENVDLKIRVNNLEKRVAVLKQPPKPKSTYKFI